MHISEACFIPNAMTHEIGIDCSALAKEYPTGVERYVKNVVQAMGSTLPASHGVEVCAYTPKSVREQLPSAWNECVVAPTRFGWTHAALGRRITVHPPRVFFTPAHEVPLFHAPQTRMVTTIHDVVFSSHPEAYSFAGRMRQELAVRHAVRACAHIFTVSHATKDALCANFGALAERITVTPLASSFTKDVRVSTEEQMRVRAQYALSDRPYFFFVGRLERKKNIAFLIRAFTQWKEHEGRGSNALLVLAGSFGYRGGEIAGLLTHPDVRHLSYVPDADIAPLMSTAHALVFPSVGEGFGIPLVDALTLGVPALVSDIPVFHEVGGNAPLFAGVSDSNAWHAGFSAIIAMSVAERARRAEQGRAHARQYSWERTAQCTTEALLALC